MTSNKTAPNLTERGFSIALRWLAFNAINTFGHTPKGGDADDALSPARAGQRMRPHDCPFSQTSV